MYLLGVTTLLSVEVYPGEVKLGSCPSPPFHINDCYRYDVMPPSKIPALHTPRVEPHKSASNQAPHLLEPALGKAGWRLFCTQSKLPFLRPVSL